MKNIFYYITFTHRYQIGIAPLNCKLEKKTARSWQRQRQVEEAIIKNNEKT